jgi:hypothetical protein
VLTGVKNFHRQYKWIRPQLLTQPCESEYQSQGKLSDGAQGVHTVCL